MNGPTRSAVDALLRVFDDQFPHVHAWVQLPALLQANVTKALELLAENGIVLELPSGHEELPLTEAEANQVIEWIGDDLTDDEIKHVRDLEITRVRSGGEADFLRFMRDTLTMDDFGGYSLVIVVLNAMTLDETHLRIVRLAVEALVKVVTDSETTDRTVVLESSRAFGTDHVTLGTPASNSPPRRRLSGRASNHGLRILNTYDNIRGNMVRLAEGWRSKPLCFFLGAGFSLSSKGMPDGDAMRNHALREMFPLARQDPIRQLGQRLYTRLYENELLLPSEMEHTPDDVNRQERFIEQLTLERVMHAHHQLEGGLITATLNWFDARHSDALASPGPAVEHMRRLIDYALEHAHRIIVFTVNFDELLDTAFSSGDHPVLNNSDQIDGSLVDLVEKFIAGDVPAAYVKLHGTRSQRASLLIDVAATTHNPTMVAFESGIQRLARASVPVVYIGHSMRDLDIRPALASQALTELNERWVTLDGPSSAIQEVQRTRSWWLKEKAVLRMHHTTADDWMKHFGHIVGVHHGAT